MRKSSKAEWEFGDERMADDEHTLARHLQPGDDQANRIPQPHKIWIVWLLGLLLLVALGGGYYLWHLADEGVRVIELEVQASAVQGHTRQVGALISLPTVTLQELTFHRDVAVAQVVYTQTSPSGVEATYRQLLFYRLHQGKWQPSAPEIGYWGASQFLETQYFTFHYRQRDEAVVAAVAAEADAMLTQMRQDFALSPLDGKLIVEVSAEAPPQNSIYARFQKGYLNLISPALLPLPAELPDAEALRLTLAAPLARHTYEEAAQRGQIPPHWQRLQVALIAWQVRAYSPAAVKWHDDLMALLYSESATNAGSREQLVGEIRQLCENHLVNERFFLLEPGTSSTPICITIEDSHLMWSALYGPPAGFETASWADRYFVGEGMVDAPRLWLENEALVSVIDTIVHTYGRDALPDMITKLSTHNSWNTLIPASFGVSVKAFEANWRNYLSASKPERKVP